MPQLPGSSPARCHVLGIKPDTPSAVPEPVVSVILFHNSQQKRKVKVPHYHSELGVIYSLYTEFTQIYMAAQYVME